MTIPHLELASGVPRSADLTSVAGIPLTLAEGDIRLGSDLLVEEELVRRLHELARVAAEPIAQDGERVEYRMLNGVRRRTDTQLEGLPLRYELTAMLGHPIGREAAKTAGHVHVRPAGSTLGYAEVVEVLHGAAGFLIQDLTIDGRGPSSSRAWLIRARPGDRVVFPPELAHVTIDLGVGPLVFSDIIDRRARGIYAEVADARGFSWYVGADGELRANDRYASVPDLEVCDAVEWSGAVDRPLYREFSADPQTFAWLSDPGRFPDAAPQVWERVTGVLAEDSG
jgi:glucose-6-phosphate isomerase